MDAASTPPTPIRRRGAILRTVTLPVVSGKTAAFVLLACFALSALAIPLAAHLTSWVEMEVVLTIWWVIWVVALTHLLFQGARVTDDYGDPFGHDGPSPVTDAIMQHPIHSTGPDELVGCLAVALVTAVAPCLIGVLLPAIAFWAYVLVRGMLARVANDRNVCRGDFDRALVRALGWATVYTVPLVLLVWGAHVWLRHRAQ